MPIRNYQRFSAVDMLARSRYPRTGAEEIVFKYFDACNRLDEIFRNEDDYCLDGIVMDTIPEVLGIIIDTSFGLAENAPNINEYIDGCDIDFDVELLTDIQINRMLARIRSVLNISPGDGCSKKYILQLYSVATVKDPVYDWHSYIMYHSDYEIVDHEYNQAYSPYPQQNAVASQ